MNGDARRPPDLRLAGTAVGVWLTALAGLHVGWRAGAVVAGLAALGAAGLVGFARSVPHRWIVAGVLVGVAAGAGTTAARVALRDAQPVAGLAAARAGVDADLTVDDDPHPTRAVAGRPPQYAVGATLTRLHLDGRPDLRLAARVLVLGADAAWRRVLPGQRVTVSGRLIAPRGGDLRSAVLSAPGTPRLVGRPAWAQRAAGSLRSGLQRACQRLPVEAGGLLPGLVDGDTSRLAPAVDDDFRATGMTHLVAVSGENVAILLGFVLGLARWCRAGPRTAAAVGALTLVAFVILVRPSPSVLRAAAMGGLALVGLATGRPRSAVPGLAAVVVLLVLVDPELAGAAGFALSVLATAGLLLVAPAWGARLRRRGVPAGLAEAVAVPAAAQLTCAPVIAAISGTVGLVAVPANLLAVPAVAPATVVGVASALLSPVWPAAARFAAWLAYWPAEWLVLVARYGARTPAGTLPWPAGAAGGLLLAAALAALLFAARYPLVRRVGAVTALAVVAGAVPVKLIASGWPPPGWLFVMCDVGQGDASVLPVGPGRAVVVDTGPEPTAVDGCLRRLGVRQVPLLVVTHYHEDHVGGVAGVFDGRSVGAVLTSADPDPAEGYRLLHATTAVHRTPVRVAAPGERYAIGPLVLTVLGPVEQLTDTRSDPNNNSLVIRATEWGRSVLLAGDAEEEEQQTLLSAALHVDILKVAHHGSAFQDPAFLDRVRPAVALVSVGQGNPYGHPNPGVLGRLARAGAAVLRTDQRGDLAAVDGGGQLAVAFRGDPRPPP